MQYLIFFTVIYFSTICFAIKPISSTASGHKGVLYSTLSTKKCEKYVEANLRKPFSFKNIGEGVFEDKALKYTAYVQCLNKKVLLNIQINLYPQQKINKLLNKNQATLLYRELRLQLSGIK